MTNARVVLTCHHTLEFAVAPPLLNAEVWCLRCGTMETVTDAPPEYRVRCRRCPYSRMCGCERLHAEVVAAKHSNKKGHPVAIYNGHKLIYVIGEQKTGERESQGTLFGKTGEAPY